MRHKQSLADTTYDDARNILSVNGAVLNYFNSMLFNTDLDAYEIGKKDEDVAKDMIMFIIEHVLCWTPREAYYHLTPEIIRKFKINEYAKTMFADDNDVQENMRNNPKFILSVVYPKEIKNAEAYRYDFVRTIDARWAPGEISSTSLGKSSDDWYNYFNEFLNHNYAIDSIERLYYIFADPPNVIKKLKDARLQPLLTTCNHPVELLDWFLVQTEDRKIRHLNFETDLEQDPFCYFAAMIHSIRFSYGRHYRKYSDSLKDAVLPEMPLKDCFSNTVTKKTDNKMLLKKKDFETIKSQICEISAIQALEDFAGELIFPSSDLFFTIDDWLAHDYEKYFDMYIDFALLLTLRDANGDYIFTPTAIVTQKEKDTLNETREFLEKAIPEALYVQ